MPQPSTFEMVLTGALVALLLFFWWPGVRRALARSREAKADWRAVLLPLALVILFVLLLIQLA